MQSVFVISGLSGNYSTVDRAHWNVCVVHTKGLAQDIVAKLNGEKDFGSDDVVLREIKKNDVFMYDFTTPSYSYEETFVITENT